jgi:hypothetical protein
VRPVLGDVLPSKGFQMTKPAIAYVRVSTAQQGRSGLGLEAQEAAIARFAGAEGYEVLATLQEGRDRQGRRRPSTAGQSSPRPSSSPAKPRRRLSSPSSTGYRATCTSSRG